MAIPLFKNYEPTPEPELPLAAQIAGEAGRILLKFGNWQDTTISRPAYRGVTDTQLGQYIRLRWHTPAEISPAKHGLSIIGSALRLHPRATGRYAVVSLEYAQQPDDAPNLWTSYAVTATDKLNIENSEVLTYAKGITFTNTELLGLQQDLQSFER